MQPEWTSEKRGKPPSYIPPLDVYGPQSDSKRLAEAWSKYIGRALVVASILVFVVIGFYMTKAFQHHETMLLNKNIPDKDPNVGLVQLRILKRDQLAEVNKWLITRKPKNGFCFRSASVKIIYSGEESFRFNPFSLHLFTEKTRYFIDLDWRTLDHSLKAKTLHQGESVEGWVFFEVPCNEKPLGLHLDGIVGVIVQSNW